MKDIKAAAKDAAEYLYADLEEWQGHTLRELFEACEDNGATVYWGFWTDEELDTKL